MPQIKYIFRDFWWVVAKLKKDSISYSVQMASAYKIPKEQLVDFASKPMCEIRRWDITEHKFWSILSKNIGVDTPKTVKTIFHNPLDSYAKVNKSIIRFVAKIQKLGYVCIILSDDNAPQVSILKKAWRYKQFNDIVVSCNVGISKFDDVIDGTTKIFDYALKKYKIKATEAIFIDDTEKNCIVAQKAWIKSILAETPSQIIKEVTKILAI